MNMERCFGASRINCLFLGRSNVIVDMLFSVWGRESAPARQLANRGAFNAPSWIPFLVLGALVTSGIVGCHSGPTRQPGDDSGGSSGAPSSSMGVGAAGTNASPFDGGGSGGTHGGGAGGGGVTPNGTAGEVADGAALDGAMSGLADGARASEAVDGTAGTVTGPGTEGDGIVMIAAPFTAAPEMSEQQGVAAGQVVRFEMANSQTFGDGSRAVGVYVPAGYVSGTEIPFMVVQDGISRQNGGSFGLDDLRPLLDNMIASGRLPMMAGIFVDPGGQRSVEYDTVSDKYYQFVEAELLPAAISQVRMKTNLTLTLTDNPEGRGAFGGSSGGAAAFTMGWFHPESYRRILTLSGSFVTLQSTRPDYPGGAGDYHDKLIPTTAPPKPLRVFLEAGSNDLGGGSWRAANDAMAQVLAAKNYHFRYVEAQGATHEDDGARRQYLPDAMLWLWRGYPIVKP
jgi:enterochelin esterase-like enzyme